MAKTPLDALNPLREALKDGRFTRLLARPGWVMGERPEGAVPVAIPWTVEQHREVLSHLDKPAYLEGHVAVTAVGPTLVLSRPVDAALRAEDLARDGLLSVLAARTLGAAVALGRNVLLTGPWSLCVYLAHALVNEGQRPALLGPSTAVLPPHWSPVPDAAAAEMVGADRVAAVGIAPQDLVATMGRMSGVVGVLDGRRLDRALMRFEAAAEQLPGRTSAPLHVLASLDLVVVLTQQGGARVREVAEIALTDSGYRPIMLFQSGLPPAPTALVPVGAPTFVDELAQAGYGTLADELRHAVPPPAAAAPVPTPTPAATRPTPMRAALPVPHAPAYEYNAPPPRAGKMVVPKAVESNDISHPGWELDRVEQESGSEDSHLVPHVDDAAMAATFGLGPPPRPPSVAAKSFGDFMHSDHVGSGGSDQSHDAIQEIEPEDESLD